MVVIGVLLVLIAAGAVALVLMAPDATTTVIELSAIGITVNATPLALFVGGAVSLALFGLGFPMITQGIRRKAKRRKELHGLRKEQAATSSRKPASSSTSTPSSASTPAAASTTPTEEPSSRPDQPQPGSKHTSNPGA